MKGDLIMRGGNRHRNMYYLTGLPGWMRFGYSPGWGDMPPGAQYIMTGHWPTPQADAYWRAMQDMNYQQFGDAAFSERYEPMSPYLSKEMQIQALQNQAEFFKTQLSQILARIEELEKGGTQD
jgi:hypothetical protein